MSRIELLNRRYAASAAVARAGVSIIAVADGSGRAFDMALRRIVAETADEEFGPWDTVLNISKALRWRRLTQPQPLEFSSTDRAGHDELVRQVDQLRASVSFGPALDALVAASTLMLTHSSPVGPVLIRSIGEVGASDCVVLAGSRAAQARMRTWLRDSGVRVLLGGELDAADGTSITYAIGPPRNFPSSVVTAPTTDEVTFMVPSWFGDISIPRSAIAPYAEGALAIRSTVLREGHEQVHTVSEGPLSLEPVDELELQPAPDWTSVRRPDRPAEIGEVEAHKLLLAGNLALWLDDGDRIRAVDPQQPAGERVIYANVGAVGVGTYLLVRTGVNERAVLYEAALEQLGPLAREADQSQAAWKAALFERVRDDGYRRVADSLLGLGVQAAERARAWTDPSLIRPSSDSDFAILLRWLGIPSEPTTGHANRLRRAIYKASAEIREELEMAVSRADLGALDRHGFLNLEVETGGFRGILATRVLAVSPHKGLIHRRDARIPFYDGGAQWLE